jgi:hypothetical protein
MKAGTAVRAITGWWLPLVLMGQTNVPRGEVRGSVVDALGVPVAGAQVTATPAGVLLYIKRWVTADQEGRFLIDRLGWAEYRVRAKKESDGYPDTSCCIFDDSAAVAVTLSPAAPSSTVVVKLGPKAGIVTPSFSDSETGRAVDAKAARVHIWIWDNPNAYFDTGFGLSGFLLIPSSKAIGIEFTVAGYDPWRCPSGPGPGEPITLAPGEKRAIQVGLRRSADMRKLDARLLEPDISETEIQDVLAALLPKAWNDARTIQEMIEVVRRRHSSRLTISLLGEFRIEALVREGLNSADPAVREAARTALFRPGVAISHVAPRLREIASDPKEEPEARQQARELLRDVH